MGPGKGVLIFSIEYGKKRILLIFDKKSCYEVVLNLAPISAQQNQNKFTVWPDLVIFDLLIASEKFFGLKQPSLVSANTELVSWLFDTK